MNTKIRYEQINHAIWHRYTDAQTKQQVPAIGLRQYYRFYGSPHLDEMTITPTLVRWGSDDNRALPAELIVHAWNDTTRSWELVWNKELPRPALGKDLRIKLGGVRTRFLRLDCLKQHTVGPSGGAQWANPHYVPFDTLKHVDFFGKPVKRHRSDLPMPSPLRIGKNHPKSHGALRVFSENDAVRFSDR